MSFQAGSGVFPTAPTRFPAPAPGPGGGGGGVFPNPAAPHIVPTNTMPQSGGIYPSGTMPPGGMFSIAGPPGMMNMRPLNPHFPSMRPTMGQPGILPMPPMPPGGTCKGSLNIYMYHTPGARAVMYMSTCNHLALFRDKHSIV